MLAEAVAFWWRQNGRCSCTVPCHCMLRNPQGSQFLALWPFIIISQFWHLKRMMWRVELLNGGAWERHTHHKVTCGVHASRVPSFSSGTLFIMPYPWRPVFNLYNSYVLAVHMLQELGPLGLFIHRCKWWIIIVIIIIVVMRGNRARWYDWRSCQECDRWPALKAPSW